MCYFWSFITTICFKAEESEKKHPKLDTEKGQKSEEGRTAAHAQVCHFIMQQLLFLSEP